MPNLISPNEIDTENFLDDYLLNILVFNLVVDTGLIEMENEFQILEATDVNYRYIKLQNDKGENLSVVRLEIKSFNHQNYYLINKSYSFIQQKGYGSILYEYCFCHLDLPIISDKYQTKAGSSNLWRRLHKKQNTNFEIFVYNEKTTSEIRLSKSLSDYAIWGVDNESINIYKETPIFYNENFEENFEDNFATAYSDDLYDPYTSIGKKYVHEQLEKYIINGLDKKVKGKRIKQKITDRGYLRLVGKNSS